MSCAVKKHECNVRGCYERFYSLQQLETHKDETTHHECVVCGARFQLLFFLQEHAENCEKPKPLHLSWPLVRNFAMGKNQYAYGHNANSKLATVVPEGAGSGSGRSASNHSRTPPSTRGGIGTDLARHGLVSSNYSTDDDSEDDEFFATMAETRDELNNSAATSSASQYYRNNPSEYTNGEFNYAHNYHQHPGGSKNSMQLRASRINVRPLQLDRVNANIPNKNTNINHNTSSSSNSTHNNNNNNSNNSNNNNSNNTNNSSNNNNNNSNSNNKNLNSNNNPGTDGGGTTSSQHNRNVNKVSNNNPVNATNAVQNNSNKSVSGEHNISTGTQPVVNQHQNSSTPLDSNNADTNSGIKCDNISSTSSCACGISEPCSCQAVVAADHPTDDNAASKNKSAGTNGVGSHAITIREPYDYSDDIIVSDMDDFVNDFVLSDAGKSSNTSTQNNNKTNNNTNSHSTNHHDRRDNKSAAELEHRGRGQIDESVQERLDQIRLEQLNAELD